jgi:hypothetical protein
LALRPINIRVSGVFFGVMATFWPEFKGFIAILITLPGIITKNLIITLLIMFFRAFIPFDLNASPF